MPNEIRIEFDYDSSDKNWNAINFTALELNKLGYSFAIYYVEGGVFKMDDTWESDGEDFSMIYA